MLLPAHQLQVGWLQNSASQVGGALFVSISVALASSLSLFLSVSCFFFSFRFNSCSRSAHDVSASQWCRGRGACAHRSIIFIIFFLVFKKKKFVLTFSFLSVFGVYISFFRSSSSLFLVLFLCRYKNYFVLQLSLYMIKIVSALRPQSKQFQGRFFKNKNWRQEKLSYKIVSVIFVWLLFLVVISTAQIQLLIIYLVLHAFCVRLIFVVCAHLLYYYSCMFFI